MASGVFTVDPIWDFCQDDLALDDVMVLDCHNELYVWEGSKSTKDEKRETLKFAFDFWDCHRKDINKDDKIFIVKQNKEPICFSGHFFGK